MTPRLHVGVLALGMAVVVGTAAGTGAAVTGAILGLLTAVSAVGLALAWRTTGVVPFAHVAIGAAPAAVTLTLVNDRAVPWLGGLAVAVLCGGLLGAAVHRLAVRPFTARPLFAATVALLAAAAGLSAVAAFAPRWVGDRLLPPAAVPGPLHERWFTLPGAAIRGDVVVVAGLVGVVLLVVVAVMRAPLPAGLVAATADDPQRAALLGVRVSRVASLAWAAAGSLAALAAFGRATVVGLPLRPADTAVALVAPLAAVIIGGSARPAAVAAGAIALGLMEHGLVAARLDPALIHAALAAVLVLALALRRGRRARTVGAPEDLRLPLPSASSVSWTAAGVMVMGVASALALGPGRASVVTMTVIVALGALSLVVMIGWTGVLWLGHIAVAAVGGATAAALAATGGDLVVCLAAAAVVGAATAAVILRATVEQPGLPTAVTSLVVAAAAPAALFGVLTGRSGAAVLPQPHLLGWIVLVDERSFAVAAVAVLATAAAAVAHLRHSRTGRLLIATRDDPGLVRACGVSPLKLRLVGAGVGGGLAGAAGALHVLWAGMATADLFPPSAGITVLVAAVVGGIGSPAGGVVGAVATVAAHQLLPAAWPFLFDVVVVLVIVRMAPGGLAALPRAMRRRTPWRRRTPVAAGLACESLVAGYERHAVLAGVDLTVAPGEIVGIVGRNGSGKTTLLATLAGLLPATSGAVALAGSDLTRAPVERRVRLGLRYAPADRPLLPSLTVNQHRWLTRRLAGASGAGGVLPPELAEVPAAELSGGEQRRLAVDLALAGTPRAVLLDEPTSGVEPAGRAATRSAIRAVAEAGAAVVVVEPATELLAPIADRILVLEAGVLRERRDDATTTGALRSQRSCRRDKGEAVVLSLAGMCVRRGGRVVLSDVDLQLVAGEAVALFGGNGAGKTTLMDAVAGDLCLHGGTVHLLGHDTTTWPAHRRARGGLARAYQTPRAFAGLTVAEALTVGAERHHALPDHLADVLGVPGMRRAEREIAVRIEPLLELLGLQPHRATRTAELSTGWRRRVALGVALAAEPVVLLLDEPSAGLDAAHRARLPALLREVIRQTGCALLIAEHDEPIAMAVADRAVRLVGGHLHEE